MKKKGFTLIELLAVIVILAVIAIIATPAVLNIIEDSKKSAAEASARSIVGAAKTHYMKNIMSTLLTYVYFMTKNKTWSLGTVCLDIAVMTLTIFWNIVN